MHEPVNIARSRSASLSRVRPTLATDWICERHRGGGATVGFVNARAKKLREEALELPKTARAKLAHDLLLSLEDRPFDPPQEVQKSWAAEIDERVRDVKEGRVKLVPVEDAVRAVRARLKRVRAQRAR